MPGDPQPSADQFFGAPSAPPPGGPQPSAPLPSAQTFFGIDQPQSGAAADDWWSNLTSATGRILAHAGQGLQDQWGGRPIGLSDEDEAKLRQAGVFNDYADGNVNFFKSLNETVMRNAAAWGDVLWNAIPAASRAIGGGLGQTATEIAGGGIPTNDLGLPTTPQGALAMPIGMLGEMAEGVSQGAYPEFAEARGLEDATVTRAANQTIRAADAARARAAGVLGEGESGFYGAEPLTTENATARASAAEEAGVPVPEPEPATPDIHTLARRVDPETFEDYDRAAADRETYRQEVAQLGAERAASPEAMEAQGRIDTILGRVNNVPSRLTNAARPRLESARTDLDAILNAETPEMAEARNRLMQADYRMRDLAPDVSAAYRRAREMAPELPETAPQPAEREVAKGEAEGEPAKAAEIQAQSQGRVAAAAGASTEEGRAEVAPASVTGDERLGEPDKRSLAPTATGFNGLRDRQGNPIRFKNDQEWKPGNKVDVGFMRGLTVHGVQAATETEDAAYILTSDKGVVYAFTPQKGIARLYGEDATHALREATGAEPAPQPEQAAPRAPPEGAGAAAEAQAPVAPPQSPEAAQAAPAPAQTPVQRQRASRVYTLRPVKGTGETVTRGLSEGVEETAIERSLTNSFGDLPEYQRVSMADQARQVAEVMAKDYYAAKRMAMGELQPPSGVLPESVFVGVEKRALAEGDVETLRDLATRSRLNTAATTMGQRIRTLGERDPSSPVAAIQAVQQAREVALAKRTNVATAKGAEVADMRAQVRATADTLKPSAWADFVSSIKCAE